MDVTSFYIPVVIAILAVAVPLIYQVVVNLVDKYSSIKIVNIFLYSTESKIFLLAFLWSLFSIFIWTLKIPSLVNIFGITYYSGNNISLFVIHSSFSLIITFFFLMKHLIRFSDPVNLADFLFNNYNNSDRTTYKYFHALSDLLIYSIKAQNIELASKINDLLKKDFIKFRECKKNQSIQYLNHHYEIVRRVSRELLILPDNHLTFLDVSSVGGGWLLGDNYDFHNVSESTYYNIWQNLELAVKHNKDDLIVKYWETAYNFIETGNSLKFANKKNDETKIFNSEHIALVSG